MFAAFRCRGGRQGFHCWTPLGPSPVDPTYPLYHSERKRETYCLQTLEIARQYLTSVESFIVPRDDSYTLASHGTSIRPIRKRIMAKFAETNDEEETDDEDGELRPNELSIREGEINNDSDEIRWATDGSCFDNSRGISRPVGFSIIGPMCASAKMVDRHATVADAKVCAIACAISLDTQLRGNAEQTITRGTLVLATYKIRFRVL